MSKLYIKTTPGTKGSQSAKRIALALSEALGYKVYRSINSFPRKQALLYGAGRNKLEQYAYFQHAGVPGLEYTTDRDQAHHWLLAGDFVFGRSLLNASCGKGIVVFSPDDPGSAYDGPDLPVFTKYKKKKREFRVHIFQDTVVRVVEKKRRKGYEGPKDTRIRNLANGYVFCSCENEPEGLRELALKAAPVVGSDFKGVDIGYNELKDELFVIEVNSAPGIEGSNVAAYVATIVAKHATTILEKYNAN